MTVSTNNTTSIYQSNDTSKTTKAKQFEAIEDSEIEPKDISFEQYTTMKRDDLADIYDIDSEEYKEAERLYNTSNTTTDSVLNKILFDKMLTPNNSVADEIVKSDISSRGNLLKFGKAIEELHNHISKYLDDNKLEASMGNFNLAMNNLNLKEPGYMESIEQNTITPEDFFKSIKITEDEYYHSTNTQLQGYDYVIYGDEIFGALNKIKNDYYKAINEKNAILDNYTKNTKTNPLL